MAPTTVTASSSIVEMRIDRETDSTLLVLRCRCSPACEETFPVRLWRPRTNQLPSVSPACRRRRMREYAAAQRQRRSGVTLADLAALRW